MAAKKKATSKKYHRMPNGELMEGARHERTESRAEKRAEYGPKVRPKTKKK
jgi:hypothetical protein